MVSLKLKPNFAEAYDTRGFSKAMLKDYSNAITDYTKAIAINPKYAIAYNNRGVSKYYLGDETGACNDARIALKLGYSVHPDFISACNIEN